MRVLRFISIVCGRLVVAVVVFPLAIVFLGFLGLLKAAGAAWSDSQ